MNEEKFEISSEHAAKFSDWLKTRGGILVWQSLDMSNPCTSSTPATIRRGDCQEPLKEGEDPDTVIPYPWPGWRFDKTPVRHVTEVAECVVMLDKEVRRFRVGLRR